jgi:pimeloyl-ACP methyl ester carboxylesterase
MDTWRKRAIRRSEREITWIARWVSRCFRATWRALCRLAERTLNVVRWTVMPAGGHFGAWERPAEFAADLKGFVMAVSDPLAQRAYDGHRARKAL